MNKSKLITIILLVMTIGLMMAIFYIGYVLTSTPDQSSPVAPVKTKAQSVAYSKIVAFNTNATGVADNPSSDGPSSANAAGSVSPSVSPTEAIATPTISPSPAVSPTGTLLAANQGASPSPSAATVSPTQPIASASVNPTVIATLPQTGNVYSAIVIFAVAGLMVFFSFLY